MKQLLYPLLTFCILNLFNSCITTKDLYIPLADFYSKDFDHIIVHTPNTIFELHDYKFHNWTLEGVSKKRQKRKSISIHIYINKDVQPNSSGIILIDRKDIQRVTRDSVKVPDIIPILGTLAFTGLMIIAFSRFPL